MVLVQLLCYGVSAIQYLLSGRPGAGSYVVLGGMPDGELGVVTMMVDVWDVRLVAEGVAVDWVLVGDGVVKAKVSGKVTPLPAHTVRSTVQACC